MSSTVGIGLEPNPGALGQKVRIRWRASFGQFVHWAHPDFKVRDLGADTTSGLETMYWSYDGRLMGTSKPEVTITATVVDDATGRVLETKTLRIVWEGDLARVARD